MNPPIDRRAGNRRFRDLSDHEFRADIERALYDDDGNSRIAANEEKLDEILRIVSSAKMLWGIAVFLTSIVTPILAVLAYFKGSKG